MIQLRDDDVLLITGMHGLWVKRSSEAAEAISSRAGKLRLAVYIEFGSGSAAKEVILRAGSGRYLSCGVQWVLNEFPELYAEIVAGCLVGDW